MIGDGRVSGNQRVGPHDDSPFDRITLADYPDQPFLIAKRDRIILPAVRATGRWETDLARVAAGLLPPAAHVVVAGGHVGLLAFQLWRARPDVREITVFEPDSVNAALLSLNIASWGPSPIRSMPMALSDSTGILTLAQNPVNTGDSRVWKTIPADLSGGGGDPLAWAHHEVVAVSLDDLWEDAPLDMLILDVQGWEPEALKGAERVLRAERPIAIFEWWPRAVAARGVDVTAFLMWLDGELQMELDVVPVEAAGGWSSRFHESVGDAGLAEITQRLLNDPEPTAYVEVVAYPRT